jgi:hypothetical protein
MYKKRMVKITTYRECPDRSPKAVSEAIKEIIKDKTVCELGCGEGDNMAFMSRYAKKVIGVEFDPERYMFARKRGFEVFVCDYRKQDLPDADVYYFWPDDGKKDDEFLVNKILSKKNFKGIIIVAADFGHGSFRDPGLSYEPTVVKAVGEKRNATFLEVPFHEGEGYRQNGKFLLAIINNL